ncbi:MAG: hypothetical protein ACYCW6_24945 [Candidatus Xenobia bacterium]
MKISQVKIPEMALDGMMAYAAIQFDHQASDPKDTVHQNSSPDGLAGGLMVGVHGVLSIAHLMAASNASYTNGKESVESNLASGFWEAVKGAGFGMQIAPSMGLLGAGMVACGTLGDVCSGWVTQPFKDWAAERRANKAAGPQGCAGPED